MQMRKEKSTNEKKFTAVEIREDVAYYIKSLESIHPNPYIKFNRNAFHKEMNQAQNSLTPPINEVDLFKVLAPVIGKLKDEHITIEFPHYIESITLPFHVRILEDRGFVEILCEDELLSDEVFKSGLEIISIQGYDFTDLVIEMQQYFFGTNNNQKQFYLEKFFGKALATKFYGKDQLEWIFQDISTGEMRSERVQMNKTAESAQPPFEYKMLSQCTALFSYREFEDPKGDYHKFLNSMFMDINRSGINNLIIDIRENTGGMTCLGDTLLSYLTQKPFKQLREVKIKSSAQLKEALKEEIRPILRTFPPQYVHPRFRKLYRLRDGDTLNIYFKDILPEKRKHVFKGNIYVLIGPGTMSSASLFAGTIGAYGIGFLVGETTGGGVSHFGCQYDYRLPNTKMVFRIPSSINQGNFDGLLSPHIEVLRTIKDHKEASDTVMEYAKNLANQISEDMAKSDISYFVNLLQNVHPAPYNNSTPEIIYQAIKKCTAQVKENIDKVEFYRQFAPIVSMLNDEHSEVSLYYQDKMRTFPYRVTFFEDRCIIVGCYAEEQLIPNGSELVSINGSELRKLRGQLSKYFSGTTVAQREFYLEENFDQALHIYMGHPDIYTLEFQNTGSKEIKKVKVKAIYKEEVEEPNFEWVKIDKKIALMTFRKFEDPKKEFKKFLKDMFKAFKRDNVNQLIIDLRKNRGGATAYGDELLKYLLDQKFSQLVKSEIKISEEVKDKFLEYIPPALRWLPIKHFHPTFRKLFHSPIGSFVHINFKKILPHQANKRFQGKIFVLIGPGTMSSASLLAATLKWHQAATIIGDASGGPATHYGNQFEFVLPYSQIEVLIPCSINQGNLMFVVKPNVFMNQNEFDIITGKDTLIEYIKAKNTEIKE